MSNGIIARHNALLEEQLAAIFDGQDADRRGDAAAWAESCRRHNAAAAALDRLHAAG